MNSKLNVEILESIIPFLRPYLDQFHEVDRLDLDVDEITIAGTVDEDSNSKTKVLKVVISHENKQVYIPNIFMPQFMKHQGVGKELINLVYQVSKRNDYELFIVGLVPSFYERLVNRGAFVSEEYDTVQITDTTDLTCSNFA